MMLITYRGAYSSASMADNATDKDAKAASLDPEKNEVIMLSLQYILKIAPEKYRGIM